MYNYEAIVRNGGKIEYKNKILYFLEDTGGGDDVYVVDSFEEDDVIPEILYCGTSYQKAMDVLIG